MRRLLLFTTLFVLAALAAPLASQQPPLASTPAPRVYTHSSGYQISLPAGWSIEERAAPADVRLMAADRAGLIEVTSGPASVALDPVSYGAGWESRAIGPSQLLKTKRGGATMTVGDRPGYAGTYENTEVISKVVFLWTPGRFFTFAATFARDDFDAGEALFDRLVRSFTLPGR